jgi:hypothetical protein
VPVVQASGPGLDDSGGQRLRSAPLPEIAVQLVSGVALGDGGADRPQSLGGPSRETDLGAPQAGAEATLRKASGAAFEPLGTYRSRPVQPGIS